MEDRIKERYTQEILEQVMATYGIADDQIRLLDGFESFIYEFQQDGKACILRVSHSLRRDEDLIRGEIDWMNFLYSRGACVSKAIPAKSRDYVVPVDDHTGDQFLASAFLKARGKPPSREIWGPSFYQKYGREIGRMHSLTKNYTPTNPEWVRPQWDSREMIDLERWLPDSEAVILEKYFQLKKHLDTLPKSKETYGLIHQDAHSGNFFVDENGELTFFDFDDCAYSWFVNDIAIVLFYSVLGAQDEAAFTRDFMINFLRGYREENDFEFSWLRDIPLFLKLREIDLYAVIHRSFDVNNIDHPWVKMFMKDRKVRIENEIPFIDFDFETL